MLKVRGLSIKPRSSTICIDIYNYIINISFLFFKNENSAKNARDIQIAKANKKVYPTNIITKKATKTDKLNK